jgi:hypothetical protein
MFWFRRHTPALKMDKVVEMKEGKMKLTPQMKNKLFWLWISSLGVFVVYVLSKLFGW